MIVIFILVKYFKLKKCYKVIQYSILIRILTLFHKSVIYIVDNQANVKL
jgi:hypothetical protein